jgi:hypothetical protein
MAGSRLRNPTKPKDRIRGRAGNNRNRCRHPNRQNRPIRTGDREPRLQTQRRALKINSHVRRPTGRQSPPCCDGADLVGGRPIGNTDVAVSPVRSVWMPYHPNTFRPDPHEKIRFNVVTDSAARNPAALRSVDARWHLNAPVEIGDICGAQPPRTGTAAASPKQYGQRPCPITQSPANRVQARAFKAAAERSSP